MSKRNPYKQLIYQSKRHKNRNISRSLQRDLSPIASSSPKISLPSINDNSDILTNDDLVGTTQNTRENSVELINKENTDHLSLSICSDGGIDYQFNSSPSISSDDNSSCESLVNYTISQSASHSPTVNLESSNLESDNLSQQLAEWAVNGQISHTNLNGLLSLLRQHNCFSDLPKDSRTLLRTPRKYTLKTIPPGIYFHFGIENGLSEIVNSIWANNDYNLCIIPDLLSLQINIDGLPLAKSSGSQLWPILAWLPQFPKISPFLIGAYHGLKKPECSNLFLEDFVTESTLLVESGFNFKGKKFKVEFSAFICDAPARAFVKKIKGHTGYYGCDRCIQKGIYLGRTVFPETTSLLRTDDGFTEKQQPQHHIGQSILENISGIKMVSHFPHDYMHLVCLGVMRKLVNLWTKGDRSVRLSQNQIGQISACLVKIKKHLPDDFARKPRPLIEMDRWKATEFRQFLLYTGPVVLKKTIKKKYFTHYVALHSAMRILAIPNLAFGKTEKAQVLIKYFLKYFSELYGCEQISYNVHSLVHLVNDVERYGEVDLFSAFKFENYLQEIKKLIKKSPLPLQQLIRRISEQRSSNSTNLHLFKKEICPLPRRVHFNGPLIRQFSNPQYSEVVLSKFTVKLQSNNNCVQMKNGNICVVENIVTQGEQLFVIGREFCVKTDFFTKPCRSSEIGVYKVKELSHLKAWDIEDISRKMLKIPLENNYFYTAVLLHH